ncbi:43639_t:CDS:2, partial [Gigaspora margarita]
MDFELSDVEEHQFDLVNPEYEPEKLSESESLSEESINNNSNEEISEIACFISCFLVKTVIYFNVPIEYLSTSQDGIATIFHVADCGKRHDEKSLKIQEVHNSSSIPYTRYDKSEVKKQQIALKHK